MKTGVVCVLAVVLFGAVVVTAPVQAIERERALALAKEARAEIGVMSVADGVAKVGKTVLVRCDKGESVQAALDKNPGTVTIEIQGICAENVRIERRSDITLLGNDPATDGLRGVVDATRYATLEIRYSTRVTLQNLSFNAASRGAGWWYSDGEINNCDFNDNSINGLYVGIVSQVRARDVEASRNGSWGIRVYRHGWLSCQSCDLVDNPWAALADEGGFGTFWDTAISGASGLLAWGRDCYLDIDCLYGDPAATHECSLNATQSAVYAVNGGQVAVLSTEFTGRLRALDGGVALQGASQLQGLVTLAGESEFSVAGGSDKQGNELQARFGPTTLQGWTRATFASGTVIDNPVTCTDAADAILVGATFEGDGSISGCEHAPAP